MKIAFGVQESEAVLAAEAASRHASRHGPSVQADGASRGVLHARSTASPPIFVSFSEGTISGCISDGISLPDLADGAAGGTFSPGCISSSKFRLPLEHQNAVVHIDASRDNST